MTAAKPHRPRTGRLAPDEPLGRRIRPGTIRWWPRRAGAAAGLLLAALALLLGPATPASAHAVLVSSSPAAEAVVPTAPSQVVLTFSEGVRKLPGKIRVLGPDGSRLDQGEPTFAGAVVTVPLRSGGARGTWLVSYRVVSADSHPVSGAFTFSVGAPSPPPVDNGAEPAADPAVSAGVKVARYLGYAGLVLLVGPILVLAVLWPHRLSRRGPARLVWTGAGLLAVGTLAGLWLQVPYTAGGGPVTVSRDGFGEVLGSAFGAAHLVRLALLVAALILVRALLTGRGGRSDQLLLAVLGVAAVFTWPVAGHPAASPVPAVSMLVDAAHLAGVAVWLGGLVMLLGFLLRQADERELTAILPVWSRWAAASVSVLLLAGVVQTLIEVGSFGALFATTYGKLVLAKIALFGVMLLAAAYSRRLIRRRIAAGRPGTMRRAVWVEVGAAAVVLALAATLVQTPPARTAGADTGTGVDNFYSTTLTSSIYSLQVEVDPARVGSNTIHLYAYTPDNKPLPVVEWRGTAALPDQGVEPVDLPLLPLTDNHAYGEISLVRPGAWQLRFTVRISEIDQATVSTTVTIR